MQSYFGRLTAIPEIGTAGLSILQSRQVAIAGTGGVGSAAACYLASLGIGRLQLIDQDIVEETNLHRLSLLDQADLHTPKAEALAQRIKARYPWTRAYSTVETLRDENCLELLDHADLIVDGSDNFQTRHVLNRFSIEHQAPYLFTSAIANQGHLSLFNPPTTPCLECVISTGKNEPVQSCESLGVSSTIVGVVGALAASEGVKYLLGLESKIADHMLTVDLATPEFIFTRTVRKEGCVGCGNATSQKPLPGKAVMLCGGSVANVLPEREMFVDIAALPDKIPNNQIVASSPSVLVYNKHSNRVTVFKTGRLLISNVDTTDDANQVAREVWNEIM